MDAGDMTERFAFDRRSTSVDGYGNTVGEWIFQFEEFAQLVMRVGGEVVQAARLAGHQPASLFVWSSTRTREIRTEWRARDVRTGDIWNIRSVTPAADVIELLIQRGVADG